MTFTHSLATGNYGPAKFIVSPNVYEGTHTTIAAALTSASSGDTIFIRPGTYTENITLKAGVNLAAYTCEAATGAITSQVIINGNTTASFTGSVIISGICFQTNSAACITHSGAAATFLILLNCFISATNNSAIASSNNGGGLIWFYQCRGNLGTTGINYFTVTGTSSIKLFKCDFDNGGGSTTATTLSGGSLSLEHTTFSNPITCTGSASLDMGFSEILVSNVIAVTYNATTGTANIRHSRLDSASASSISIGAGATGTVVNTIINSSNTNAITGAGTLIYTALTFTSTSSKINTTTQTGGTLQGGLTQAPSAGFLGEQIVSAVTASSPITLSSGVVANMTSIDLTPGIWDINLCMSFSGATVGTSNFTGISINSASFTGTQSGDSKAAIPFLSSAAAETTLSIPQFRQVVTTTTTYFAVALSFFTTGTQVVYGRLSAVRVG